MTWTGYSAIVNHLDFTSVAFPVTFVNQSIDISGAQANMLNAEDVRIQSTCE